MVYSEIDFMTLRGFYLHFSWNWYSSIIYKYIDLRILFKEDFCTFFNWFKWAQIQLYNILMNKVIC